MEKYKVITDEIETTILPKIIARANAEVESDIIKSFEYGYFPDNFYTKTFRELAEVIIRPYYRSPFDELYKDAISDNWGYGHGFNYGDIVEQIAEESFQNDLIDFVYKIYKGGKYQKLLADYISSDEEDDVHDGIVEFCCELYVSEFYLSCEKLSVYAEDPTLEELYKKYSGDIEKYRKALAEYTRNKNWFEAKLQAEMFQIVVPRFNQQITKNDTALLKFLTENFSKREITLMIQMHKIIVSNSLAAQYPAIQYPIPRPDLHDFIVKRERNCDI